MSGQYYFFGAGNNCYSAMIFLGTDQVIAIVDNSSTKIGSSIMGKLVIDFAEFKQNYNGEQVIITAYVKAQEIKQQLEENGIYNYYICPYMVNGFPTAREIVDFIRNYNNVNRILLWGNNPLTYRIKKEIQETNDLEVCISEQYDVVGCTFQQYDLIIDVVKDDMLSSMCMDNYINIDQISEILGEQCKSKLRKLRDVYKGRRCFLVGNGPSLIASDLGILSQKKEISFGCNQIFKIFDKTNWRPSNYIIADRATFEECKNHIPAEATVFIRNFMDKGLDSKEKVFWYNGFLENVEDTEPKFSTNIAKGTYSGRTVMYDMMQIAVYMGFEEIYLIGVDFSWGEDGRNAHFCSDYMESKNFLEEMSYSKKANQLAYIAAKKYADANGIRIYNATRGGHLEVFPRVSFDQIFNN